MTSRFILRLLLEDFIVKLTTQWFKHCESLLSPSPLPFLLIISIRILFLHYRHRLPHFPLCSKRFSLYSFLCIFHCIFFIYLNKSHSHSLYTFIRHQYSLFNIYIYIYEAPRQSRWESWTWTRQLKSEKEYKNIRITEHEYGGRCQDRARLQLQLIQK